MTNDPANFTKLVPGFEFLQTLVKNAGAALPGIGQWVAPTIDPAEVEKRIEELRTVQFWLEQNARMLGATIQAMEVQRMTLSTLKTMNVQMEDLRDSLQIRTPSAPPQAEPAPAQPVANDAPASADAPAVAAGTASNPAVVDPLQWWGALTKQFTELATTAMKDTASDAARNLAGAMVKKSFDSAGLASKPAAPAPAKKAARKATRTSAAKRPARKRAAAAPR